MANRNVFHDRSGERGAAHGGDRSGCPAAVHGTAWAARHHRCGCPDAVEAARLYRKRQRTGRLEPVLVSGLGTQRRIRALQAIGHTTADLAGHVGCTSQHITWLSRAHDRGDRVRRDSHDRVRALYAALRGIPGGSVRIAKIAAGRRWARPDQWDDADLDDPTARSDLDYTRAHQHDGTPIYPGDLADLEAAMPIPAACGQTAREQFRRDRDRRIAAQLGVTVDRLHRARHSHGLSWGSPWSDADILDVRDRYLAEVVPGRITAQQLAEQVGMTGQQLARVLSGRARPHLALTDIRTGRPRANRTAAQVA